MADMTKPIETGSVLMEKNRMESLTDGIFAFAMTLLVTSMILPGDAVPSLSSDRMLLSLLPEFYHYLIAFFVLAAFWMSHHEQFCRVHNIDNKFLYLNLTGLFFVTLVPFSTSFIGDYDSDTLATCLFEFNLLILGLIFSLQWLYATRNLRLISPDFTETSILGGLYHGMIIPVISLIGIIISLAGFGSSTMVYLIAPLVSYAVDGQVKRDTSDRAE